MMNGMRKKPISDVEQILIERNNYKVEARYVKTIRNWQRVRDERGLKNHLLYIP